MLIHYYAYVNMYRKNVAAKKKIEPDFHLRVVNNINKAKYKFIKGICVKFRPCQMCMDDVQYCLLKPLHWACDRLFV